MIAADTLDPVEAAAPAISDTGKAAEALHEYAFSFNGSGSEYFRIWIVNIALTISTLGIYSAWAKVRRMQYFYRNTALDGFAFNFHASAFAILLGRAIAVILAVAYHYAFGFSLETGLAVVATLVVAMPFLMMNALRFRLRYTSYRGLRFGFDGRAIGAYAAYAPVVLLITIPGALAAAPATARYAAFSVIAYLGWPFLYAAMKRYQHGNLRYADKRSTFSTPTGGIFKAYAAVSLMVILTVVLIFMVVGLTGFFVKLIAGPGSYFMVLVSTLSGVAMGCIIFLALGPYTTVRIAELAWNHTQIADTFIDSHVDGARLLELQARNVMLTLATLGLYRPFAVVSEYRYRLSCTTVCSTAPLSEVLASPSTPAPGATGDGASDLLGFDLAW